MKIINTLRADLRQIAHIIEPGARVLDIGCGDGSLLAYLKNEKNVDTRGIEIKSNRVNAAVSKGLAVIHGNAEEELIQYPDKAFDFAIIARTLPVMAAPKEFLSQLTRIAHRSIISFSNFGYWEIRWHLIWHGTMPVTRSLDNTWYETENIHLCTVKDFIRLTEDMDLKIERCYRLVGEDCKPFTKDSRFANLLAEEAIFVVSGK